jgi:hypothetical protein
MAFHSSCDRGLYFWNMVVSILGDNGALVLGMAANFLCPVCTRAAIMKEDKSIKSGVKHAAGCWASHCDKPPVAFERMCSRRVNHDLYGSIGCRTHMYLDFLCKIASQNGHIYI